MLHDPSGPFCAQHAFVHRVVSVALNVGDLAVFHVDVNPAATGAHVTCGLADFVRHLWRCLKFRLLECHLAPSFKSPRLSREQIETRKAKARRVWLVCGHRRARRNVLHMMCVIGHDASACTAVTAIMSRISSVLQPRLRSLAGAARPCKIGPIALAPPMRCAIL